VIDPAREPRFFEALELIAWLCEASGQPKPNRARFDGEQRLIQFEWTEAEFAGTWEIDAFVEGVRMARAAAAGTVV
jgi:hypothetical protein